ncbi:MULTISPECIES: hypothetical protein [Rhizobium]|uniref:hypothetical protein n=1 Tax=Rhizobium TaxID=379 RepID=UPI00039C8F7B|nr:hypothetical protein [Rhizobium leguminosarum]MBA8834176.1 hypothetical protein [Rhizobium leguminosarum]MBP2487956.1 hypothetical protein [Rhizobium leguminosarum]MBY5462402.1 hypothetical protein [Rhizobium leguminosarum]MDH6273996.1 hypothetical protein [Rhizobium leguminosarum]MDV4162546.1 hypothetical protein [Rhizobium leguminosarum]
MESRALAEYARCSRAERLNLALRRNIPDASGLLAAKEKIQEKGPAEARPSLIRSGENRNGAQSIPCDPCRSEARCRCIGTLAKEFFEIGRKDRLPKISAHVAPHLSHCSNDWRLQCL